MRTLLRALGVCVVALVCSFPAWAAVPAEATTLNLHRGSTGPAVKLLETRLHKLHLLGPRAVNRRYTRTTARAVKRFQLRHHLPSRVCDHHRHLPSQAYGRRHHQRCPSQVFVHQSQHRRSLSGRLSNLHASG